VTRAREQQSELATKLERLGASVIEAPAIKIDPVDFNVPSLENATYVIFTSTNGVHITMKYLFAEGFDARYFFNVSLAAIGEATAQALHQYGLIADIVPQRFVAEELVELFPETDMAQEVVCFRAAEVRDALEKGLESKGYTVTNVEVYTTSIADVDEDVHRHVAQADAITFASSSTVKNAVKIFGENVIREIPVKISIGPITSSTMRELNLEPTREADPHTIDGIVMSVTEAF
jgi:uroporphyrinogen III methyltransferase/synthase